MKHPARNFSMSLGLKLLILVGILALFTGGAFLIERGATWAQMKHHGMGKHQGMGRQHGKYGSGHDMQTMPGLRGLDATEEESAELAEMFRNFPDISREVEKLPDGIRTVTYSANDELMAVITSHVVGMINRVEEGRDPKIFIQSPTLDIIFERADRIRTEIDSTDEGVVVVQTSDDPEVVKALHTHADEVSDMADRGMQAVHEAMMGRHHN
ncbi:MAG: hypothetical protein ACR2O8_11320 [Rhizobiaceae bacterium]